jgi:Holliday junction resolvasome RuvABC ATP-dependent DNA helicase subunit
MENSQEYLENVREKSFKRATNIEGLLRDMKRQERSIAAKLTVHENQEITEIIEKESELLEFEAGPPTQ